MKTFNKCACCVLGCVVSCALKMEAIGQSHADSVLNSIPAYNDYNEMYKSNTHLLHGDTARVGQVSLCYNSEAGSFHKSQEAHQIQFLDFKAKGVATLKRIKLSGQFLFQQGWSDSLNNTLSGSGDHFLPFYFFATKHGKYEHQNYGAHTQIAYNLIPQKISLGLGIDYTYQWMTRSVDPRPEGNIHQLLLKPEVIGQFNKHKIGVQGIWGYGSDMTSLKFKNTVFTQSLAYPDRIYYNNQGFGFISIKDPFMRIYRTTAHSGAKLSYNYKDDNLDIHSGVSYVKIEHLSSQSEALTKNRIINSAFDEANTAFDVTITYDAAHGLTHQLIATYHNRKGADWNSSFNANSYNAQVEDMAATYYQYFAKRKYHFYWGLNVRHYYTSQTDAATSHSLIAQQISPKLLLGATLIRPKANYGMKFNVGYTHPISASYTVPTTQENVFSKNILYPNYMYFTTAQLQYGAEFKISILEVVGDNSLNVLGGIGYLQALNNTTPIPNNTAWVPGGNRFSLNLGLSINL